MTFCEWCNFILKYLENEYINFQHFATQFSIDISAIVSLDYNARHTFLLEEDTDEWEGSTDHTTSIIFSVIAQPASLAREVSRQMKGGLKGESIDDRVFYCFTIALYSRTSISRRGRTSLWDRARRGTRREKRRSPKPETKRKRDDTREEVRRRRGQQKLSTRISLLRCLFATYNAVLRVY